MLSQYELERKATIRANELQLAALGLADFSLKPKRVSTPRTKRKRSVEPITVHRELRPRRAPPTQRTEQIEDTLQLPPLCAQQDSPVSDADPDYDTEDGSDASDMDACSDLETDAPRCEPIAHPQVEKRHDLVLRQQIPYVPAASSQLDLAENPTFLSVAQFVRDVKRNKDQLKMYVNPFGVRTVLKFASPICLPPIKSVGRELPQLDTVVPVETTQPQLQPEPSASMPPAPHLYPQRSKQQVLCPDCHKWFGAIGSGVMKQHMVKQNAKYKVSCTGIDKVPADIK